MNNKPMIRIVWLIGALLIGPPNVWAAKHIDSPQVPLNTAGKQLLAQYSDALAPLRAEIVQAVPKIDEQKKAAFLKAYADEATANVARDAAINGRHGQSKNKAARAKAIKDADKALAQSRIKTLAAAKAILVDVDRFLASDRMDDTLVKCAVLAEATPRGLAEFAQQGHDQQALVKKLLGNDKLMKQMLEADGAVDGKYGQAMQIYTAIQNASPRAHDGLFQRLALGTSLEQAVPVQERHSSLMVDPVKRYLSYEKAYLQGQLDPAFKNLNVWQYRMVTNADAPDNQLAWGREMLGNYRPDIIRDLDYRWRYSKIVRTDVAYRSNAPTIPGLDFYPNIINCGGVCGRRAFFGRFILKAFGIPTWGVTEKGHAALSHWTPQGWVINFGANWKWDWWRDRPGTNFVVETQSRAYPKQYMKVLRAQWIGDALGEKKVAGRRYGTGGFWNALALYEEKAIVAEAKPMELAPAGADLAEANESKTPQAIAKLTIAPQDKKIVMHQGGVITIPAVACSKPRKNTRKILMMKNLSGDGTLLHYNRLGKPETFEYIVDVPHAGNYSLLGRVITVNLNRHLLLTLNHAQTAIPVPLPYTQGMCGNTKPVEVALVQGRNILDFTGTAKNDGVSIAQFTMIPVR